MSMPNVADVADLPNRPLLQIENYLTISAELASTCERRKRVECHFQQDHGQICKMHTLT